MPRQRRMLSESHIYHVVLKGINNQQLFFDDIDYLKFLCCFKQSCDDYNSSILAYCLMNNHIHLLMKFNNENFSDMFKSFGATYVPRYNSRYKRTGPLFNGRFYSKPINDDLYFKTVVKYIHYNPVKAGLCTEPKDYKWSSYNEYEDDKFRFVNSEYLYSLMTVNEFNMLHIEKNEDLISFFGIDYSIDKDKNILDEFVNSMRAANKNELEIIANLQKTGVSKRKIAKELDMDIRSLSNRQNK